MLERREAVSLLAAGRRASMTADGRMRLYRQTRAHPPGTPAALP
jgi:hypothetical protein